MQKLTYDNIYIQCDNKMEVKYEKHKCNARPRALDEYRSKPANIS